MEQSQPGEQGSHTEAREARSQKGERKTKRGEGGKAWSRRQHGGEVGGGMRRRET